MNDKEKIEKTIHSLSYILKHWKEGSDVLTHNDIQTILDVLEEPSMNDKADKEKIEAIKKIFDQSRMKRMSLAEEFGEEELTGMNNAIEKIVYS